MEAAPLDKEATMAQQDSTSEARFGTLHELLTRAEGLDGVTVQLSIHNVPVPVALDWLQSGLLQLISPGAGANPPTGEMDSGSWPGTRASAVVYTDGPRKEA
jgi:hypothetical protein